MKFIDFDLDGSIIEYNINDQKNIKKDSYGVAYSNRVHLNDWCNADLNFNCSNGVGVESFFEETSWFSKFKNKENNKYFWGYDTIRKIKNSNSIFGACPFVYFKKIYQDLKFEEKYQVIFLPKSDCKFKMQLDKKRSSRIKFREIIENMNFSNPIYIAFPLDYEYYERFLPTKITHRMYCLGVDGFEIDWNDKLLKLILNAKELYFNVLSTPCVFSGYLGKPIKFYNSNIQCLPKEYDIPENIHSVYGYSKKEKNKDWIVFMQYIKDVFENKTDDFDFWIYNFLSLDLIKKPEDLYKDLLILHKRDENNSKQISIPDFDHNCYQNLKDKVDSLNPKRSKTIDYFYDKL